MWWLYCEVLLHGSFCPTWYRNFSFQHWSYELFLFLSVTEQKESILFDIFFIQEWYLVSLFIHAVFELYTLHSSSSSVCSAQGQDLHCKHRNLGCSSVESTVSLPPQTQDPRLQFYQWLNRCDSFLLPSALHSLFSIWTNLKRSEKITGAPMCRWGEWIWLTGPSRLHWNSPQELNITSGFLTRSKIRKSQSPFTPTLHYRIIIYFLNFMLQKILYIII